MNTDTYPVEQIDVGERLRRTNPDRVAEIALSIDERGLLQPIGLTAEVDGRRSLVFGAHRLAAFAASKGGKGAIPFVERDAPPDELRMMEIDENLYRNELTPLDYAEFLHERSLIWQRLNRPFRRGRPSRNERNLRQLDFFEDLQKTFRLSPDTVKRALHRRRAICTQAWFAIRRSSQAWSGAALDRLAELEHHPEHQVSVVERIEHTGGAVSVATAIAGLNWKPAKEPSTPLERAQRAWTKLDDDERRAFKAWVARQPAGGAA